jgi:hypothetical protein
MTVSKIKPKIYRPTIEEQFKGMQRQVIDMLRNRDREFANVNRDTAELRLDLDNAHKRIMQMQEDIDTLRERFVATAADKI